MTHQPSLKLIDAFLNPETRKVLSFPLTILITGAFSQVETTIELANRVCDSVFQRSLKTTVDSEMDSLKTRRK